ncbi:hypothetical protein TNCV_4141191 [Trichonephila clavipes]|nr:hypothetical protein TNCV_4141191 [Trichonephila clavipes]
MKTIPELMHHFTNLTPRQCENVLSLDIFTPHQSSLTALEFEFSSSQNQCKPRVCDPNLQLALLLLPSKRVTEVTEMPRTKTRGFILTEITKNLS